MSISRAFAICISIAFGIEVLQWLLGTTSPIAVAVGWLKYAPLLLLGILLGRAGHSYATAFANSWPFVLLWIAFLYIGVQFPDASAPPEILAKARSFGWGPYLVFALFGLLMAFAVSAVGIWFAHLIRRRNQGNANAA